MAYLSAKRATPPPHLLCTMFEQFGLNRAGFSSASSSCIPSCLNYTYLPFLLPYFFDLCFYLLANSRALLLFCLEFHQQQKRYREPVREAREISAGEALLDINRRHA